MPSGQGLNRNRFVLGREIYEKLFGGLSAEALGARHWLLALDGALLHLLVAAIIIGNEAGENRTPEERIRVRYLIEAHSLQLVTRNGRLEWGVL